MYEFWYDYAKPRYGENAKFCHMDTDSFILYIEQVIFVNTLQKILKLDSILQIMNQIGCYQKKRNKKVIGLIKNESGGKIKTKFVGLKENSHLLNRQRKWK